jgi:serine protease Do
MTKFIFQVCFMLIINLVSFPFSAYASSAENIYDEVKDSIFTVYSIDEENKEKSALGSGVAVAKSLIATNCHVALAGSFLFVEVNQENHLGRLVYYNQKKDICFIEIVGSPLKPANIRPSKTVKIGEEVFAIGNPEGSMKSISSGIISNKIKDDGIEILQTDASISHGSSGGGLFDVNGNLIGITTWAHKTGENMSFALPTELILEVIGTKKSSYEPTKKETEKSSTELKIEYYDNTLTRIGYYGDDEIALMKWNGRCIIGITGRYKDKPTSLALWFPHKPEGLFIFSRVVNAENAIRYFNWINEKENILYQESKSYLYFDKKLYPLPIMAVDNVKQPVYLFALSGDITEELIELDYFVGQFYGYTQAEGMTTIKFGLTGFTEAFGAYTKHCK